MIDLRYLQENRLAKKKEKDFGKTKSTDIFSNDISIDKYQ